VNEILDNAPLAFRDAGYCAIPAAVTGTKQPWPDGPAWERYKSELPDRSQVSAWFSNGRYDGFGLVCGAVSGGLEMLELEGRAVAAGIHVAYRDALADHGLAEVWQRVVTGYTETTPSGGLHILYRVDGKSRGNTRLAVTAAGEPLIETRGEGGFTIVAPSAGRTHPTGKPWRLSRGGPATIATITSEERDALHAIASLLTQAVPRQPVIPPAASDGHAGDRPGDDYSARASWQDILAPHGWRPVRNFGDGAIGWCRPGKEGAFISATTRETGGLYVFSTSTPFDTETPYSKFAACAVLNHGGDYAAAARQLRRDGYGAPRERDDDGISDLVATKPVGSPAMASATSATTAIPAASWAGDLAKLLDDVYGFLGRFIAYPSKHAHLAHALWIAHTHVMDAWESTPRIAFLSPEPGSGKTRALEVSELLVPRPVEAVNTTPAYLFRKVSDQAGLPTILYDEIDTLFGPKAKDNEEIRGMLNAGHRRGAVAGRCVVRGKVVETEELPAYCALALAGLGGLPDTLLTRSVVVRMKRRAPDEKVEPFRRRVHLKDGNALRDQLAAWGTSAVEDLGGKWPEMPAGVEDRDADVWEALLAIADAAGGVWPAKARAASVALVADAKAATPSLGIRLLADIRAVWDATDAMHTETLLDALNKLDEAPWGDLRGKPLDPRRLSRFMRDYDVHPADVRADVDGEEKVRKGYKREDLHDAWLRYLPPLPTCAACGERMTVIEEGQTTHPGCGTELTP
jgi:Protein of unknown function (DUF3631)/Bifunctional DNA primase/polymerase, N-terminal